MLEYDADDQVYRGERYELSLDAYELATDMLVHNGMDEAEALQTVSAETWWAPGVAGVTELASAPRCRHCRGELRHGDQRYCDVVCEAASCASSCW
jgi:hypothetical protein